METAFNPSERNEFEEAEGQRAFADAKPEHLTLSELLLIFFAAMALRLAYNFIFKHANNFSSCDAYEYLNNALSLLHFLSSPPEFWQSSISCLSGTAAPADWTAVKSATEPLKDFYISGPVFPALLSLFIALSGQSGSSLQSLSPALLTGYSIISALTCVFIALVANEAFGKRTARFATLFSIIYPGFIVNSGRLYSETFAAFLLVALTYVILRGFRTSDSETPARKSGNSFILVFFSGFLAAALQLTRSVMVVVSLAILPLTAIQQSGLRRLTFLLPLAIGFMLVALPWLAFQKLAFGGGGLVVNRVGHYNLFIGTNTETQGWLSYPYPDGRGIESKTFPQLLKESFSKSPSRWLRLMLDKPIRLFKFPWNDFRSEIGPLKFAGQVLIHQILLVLGCIGVTFFSFLSTTRVPSRREIICRLFIAGTLLFHFIYFLFITVPRYNLCAIPELIIFAAAAAAGLAEMLKAPESRASSLSLSASSLTLLLIACNNFIPWLSAAGIEPEMGIWLQSGIKLSSLIFLVFLLLKSSAQMLGYRRASRICVISAGLLLAPLFLLPLRANGRALEWQSNLSSGSNPTQQKMRLPVDSSSSGNYLIIDAERLFDREGALQLKVNGTNLSGPIIPGLSLIEGFDRLTELSPHLFQREAEHIWDSLSISADCENRDLRQWFLVPLPANLINEAKKHAAEAGLDFAELDLSLANLSSSSLRIFGSYATGENKRTLPSLHIYSWEKAFCGVENSEWLTDPRYDIRTSASSAEESQKDLSTDPGLQSGYFNTAILQSPTDSDTNSLMRLKLKPVSILAPETESLSVLMPAESSREDRLLILSLKGKSHVKSGNACPSVEILIKYLQEDGAALCYQSSFVPRRLKTGSRHSDFQFAIPLPSRLKGAAAKQVIIKYKSVSPESPISNLKTSFSGKLEFAENEIELFALPSNPVGPGHKIY